MCVGLPRGVNELQDKEFICFLTECDLAFKFVHGQYSALQYNLYLICDTGEQLMAGLLLELNFSHDRRVTIDEIQACKWERLSANFAAKELLE